MLRSIWTAPPLRIPASLFDRKHDKECIEVPPALILGAAGLLLAYGYLRTKKISPFDWLWKEIDKVAKPPATVVEVPPATGEAHATTAADVTDVGATIPTETVVVNPATKAEEVVKTTYRLLIAKKGNPRATFDKATDQYTVATLTEFSYSWVVNGKTASSQPDWYAILMYSIDKGVHWNLVGTTGIIWDNRSP